MLTEDTYTGDPNDPLSLNLYTYCENEPIMYFDPLGHDATSISYNGHTYSLYDLDRGEHWLDEMGVPKGESKYIRRTIVKAIRDSFEAPSTNLWGPNIIDSFNAALNDYFDLDNEGYLTPLDYVPAAEYLPESALNDPNLDVPIFKGRDLTMRQMYFQDKMRTDKAFAQKITTETMTDWRTEGAWYGFRKSFFGIVNLPYDMEQSVRSGHPTNSKPTFAEPIYEPKHKTPIYPPNIKAFNRGNLEGNFLGFTSNFVVTSAVGGYMGNAFKAAINAYKPVQMSMLESEIAFSEFAGNWGSLFEGTSGAASSRYFSYSNSIAPGSKNRISFMPKNDTFAINAANTPTKEGYFDLIMHADENGFSIPIKDAFGKTKWKNYTPKKVVKLLKKSGYKGGPIRLLSCNTGKLEEGAAQELANLINNKVLAPDDFLWAHPNGDLTIGATKYVNNGNWVKFEPTYR